MRLQSVLGLWVFPIFFLLPLFFSAILSLALLDLGLFFISYSVGACGFLVIIFSGLVFFIPKMLSSCSSNDPFLKNFLPACLPASEKKLRLSFLAGLTLLHFAPAILLKPPIRHLPQCAKPGTPEQNIYWGCLSLNRTPQL